MSPWLSIVLLGVAITGYAWMMPKTKASEKGTEFVSEEAYNQLLEDLELENRELFDAVAKFKKEQDETVEKLGRRIVDMEYQMKKWSEQSAPNRLQADSSPLNADTPADPASGIQASAPSTETPSIPIPPSPAIESLGVAQSVVEEEKIVIPPNTIRGRYPELIEMHNKGRSVEQIAKAMGMNKGEVQLILQLVRREELSNA